MEDIWEKTQKEWIKNLLLAYKPNAIPDNIWGRVSEMVGYFNADDSGGRPPAEQQLGPGPMVADGRPHHPEEAGAPVKRLVCSPDLPVFSLTQAFEEAAAAAVAESSAPSPTTAPPPPPPQQLQEKASYECSFCHKTFPQRNTYQNHLRSHGKEGEDPYQCNICGKTFAVPARLTRHYRTHTGEKPYQCEYCSKSFSVKENLSVHRRIHTKERPYKCDICARAFEHSGKLHRHMRIHTGERPHKCGVCAKTFIQSGQLVIHMRTHTGEKPYVCAACGKGFTCSKQLKVHTRTHTGEKPYSCDICGKAFGYNHVLKLHQVAHFGEKVYKCTICSETFTSKKNMEIHIKSHSEPAASAGNSVRSPQQSVAAMESSCASSSSDKENKGVDSDSELPPPSLGSSDYDEGRASSASPPMASMPFSPPSFPQDYQQPQQHQHHHHHHHQQQQQQQQQQQHQQQQRELCYYLPRMETYHHQQEAYHRATSGVNPVLLAVAAAASEGRSLSPLPGSVEDDVYRKEPSPALPVTEPSVYLIPEPLASMQRRSVSPYHLQLPPPEYLEPPVQEDAKDPLLTPPSSNPVSPVPSPDPLEVVAVARETLILPPRKRSKMILKSMEVTTARAPERSRSVIHYARAS